MIKKLNRVAPLVTDPLCRKSTPSKDSTICDTPPFRLPVLWNQSLKKFFLCRMNSL